MMNLLYTYVSGDEIRHKSILGAVILLDGRPNGAIELLAAEGIRRAVSSLLYGASGTLSGGDSCRARCLLVYVLAPGDVGEVVLVVVLGARHGRSICGELGWVVMMMIVRMTAAEAVSLERCPSVRCDNWDQGALDLEEARLWPNDAGESREVNVES